MSKKTLMRSWDSNQSAAGGSKQSALGNETRVFARNRKWTKICWRLSEFWYRIPPQLASASIACRSSTHEDEWWANRKRKTSWRTKAIQGPHSKDWSNAICFGSLVTYCRILSKDCRPQKERIPFQGCAVNYICSQCYLWEKETEEIHSPVTFIPLTNSRTAYRGNKFGPYEVQWGRVGWGLTLMTGWTPDGGSKLLWESDPNECLAEQSPIRQCFKEGKVAEVFLQMSLKIDATDPLFCCGANVSEAYWSTACKSISASVERCWNNF